MGGFGAARAVIDLGLLTEIIVFAIAAFGQATLDSHEGRQIPFTDAMGDIPLLVRHDGEAQTGIRIHGRWITHLMGILQDLIDLARGGLSGA